MCDVPQGWEAADVMGPDSGADDADSSGDGGGAGDVLVDVCLDPNFEMIPNQDLIHSPSYNSIKN